MIEAVQRVYEAAADAVIENDDAVVFVGADKFRALAIAIQNGLGAGLT
jgi:glucan biosynthesis protein